MKLALQSFVLAAFVGSAPLLAQTLPSSAHTASGLELAGPQLTLRVDALRADVLRVRMWPNGKPAEDASWAVLPEARTARVKVNAEGDGFSTSALRVKIGGDQRLTVTDLSGNVLQDDALPVAWSADGFRVSKVKAS